jgi:hypothetical protein
MAIARRKAGTVVRCPTCDGQVVVPNLDAGPDLPARGGGKANVFERSDFDDLFQNPEPLPAPHQPPGFAFEPAPGPAPPAAGGFDVESPMMVNPRRGRKRGFTLSTGCAVLLFLVVAALLGGAFYAGMLVGQGN